MAEQAATPTPTPSKSSPLKAILLVVAVLVIEGGTIVGTMMLTGGPANVQGEEIAQDLEAEQNKLVEMPLISAKFTNERSGRTYYYDTEIYVTVKNKNSQQFKDELEAMKIRITNEVLTIFRRAELSHFQEPNWSTLTRQIKAVVDERIGKDAQSEPIVQQVVIGKCNPYRGD